MTRRDVIAIGGSLGAVDAVKKLCQALPADLAASVFIVIHVGTRGNDLLASIFDEHSSLTVSTAVDGEAPQLGHVYVAPADNHLLVIDGALRLGRGPRENMARPAIDPLFRSVGVSFGPRAIAVVLTGVLNDGAAGLADLKRCGGITVVQNPTDALADEMPLGALRGSDVDYRAPLSEMAALLVKLTKEDAGPPVEIPLEIRTEVEIALGRVPDSRLAATFSDPVALSCPGCGGVLSQVRRWPPLRFRCQVGHAYSAEVLADRQGDTVEDSIRMALRILEERIVLMEKMADDALHNGRPAAAASYKKRIQECRHHADVLRRAMERA